VPPCRCASPGAATRTIARAKLLFVAQSPKRSRPASEQLASEASHIEIEELKEPIGKQDQYASAYGGINKITFLPKAVQFS
jgi:D-glycero-alpha-D-manno-heptose-7-phosphate kinase